MRITHAWADLKHCICKRQCTKFGMVAFICSAFLNRKGISTNWLEIAGRPYLLRCVPQTMNGECEYEIRVPVAKYRKRFYFSELLNAPLSLGMPDIYICNIVFFFNFISL